MTSHHIKCVATVPSHLPEGWNGHMCTGERRGRDVSHEGVQLLQCIEVETSDVPVLRCD